MAAKKVFLTGATGYIGGSVLEGVIRKYPKLCVTALLRNPSEEFKARYPDVKIEVGDFDAFEVIEKAASASDIVLHMGDIDHPGCAAAILSGLSKRTAPSFLIHLTGTGCISDEREQTWDGKCNPHIWHDVDEMNEIYNLPDSAMHHVIDKNIMDASNELLHTACICPPDIYGQSTGIGSRATFLVPEYVKVLLTKKEAFYLGSGENMRAVTHINDVVDLFLILLEKGIEGGGDAQWGKEGFYFAVSGEIKWADAANAICNIGVEQGWLPEGSSAISWTEKQVASIMPDHPGRALYIWGSNSRAVSARAKNLGWSPNGPSFWEALREDVMVTVATAQKR
ncbi:hypothetical protein OIDMADRAFT_50987 [Oidiodendron maius Zn]|uniref:NAD-dependent epimerase/dehydratase domain-containing protein n=1 Tax=Oidiodendron maius (strain Zn) TaxID=913774 RepID=A0A0C3HQ84_OIDMZ|nr:hypothetical protein OIDMADRAFT_50987 [Oidiodendron maius Zn]